MPSASNSPPASSPPPRPPTPGPPTDPGVPPPSATREPDHIEVDHILIGVASAGFPQGKRSEADARAFAKDLFAKLKSGTDWSAAKRQYSEDPPPGGPYKMANRGIAPAVDEFERDGMVPAFGNVGFALQVGEMGLAAYDPRTSKFGFHIIKRTK